MAVGSRTKQLDILYTRLYTLRRQVLQEGIDLFETWKPCISRKSFLYSALNLAFYLALRSHDLRALQRDLLPLGLSSLGRSEAREELRDHFEVDAKHVVLATLYALQRDGKIKGDVVAKAIADLGIDTTREAPVLR